MLQRFQIIHNDVRLEHQYLLFLFDTDLNVTLNLLRHVLNEMVDGA